MTVESPNKMLCLDKSKCKDYGDSDRILWESLLVFALRRGFRDTAQNIVKAMKRHGYLPACLLFWCVAAQSSHLISMAQAPIQIASRLDELTQVAERLASTLDNQNPLVVPLRRYKLNADKLIMQFYMEFEPPLSWPEIIQRLNQRFPVTSTNNEIQAFRCEFAKLLVSATDTAKYLKETWQPNRVAALKALAKTVLNVTACFPKTIIDEVGTENHSDFVAAIVRINSNLSTIITSVLHDPEAICTHEHLISITQKAAPL